MTKKSKIFLTIFVVIISILGYWSFKIIRERNFTDLKKTTEMSDKKNAQEINADSPASNDQNISSETASNEETVTDENGVVIDENVDETDDVKIIPESNNFLDINSKDCGNNCKNFKKTQDFKYCQQVCGLAPQISKETPKKEGCQALSGLEADYCFKNDAISKHEMGICDQIKDLGIQKICRNRIASYIIDSQAK